MRKKKIFLLSDLRKAKGLSQRDLATYVDISPGAIGLYESGRRKPSLENALKISNFFEVPVEQIKFNNSEL